MSLNSICVCVHRTGANNAMRPSCVCVRLAIPYGCHIFITHVVCLTWKIAAHARYMGIIRVQKRLSGGWLNLIMIFNIIKMWKSLSNKSFICDFVQLLLVSPFTHAPPVVVGWSHVFAHRHTHDADNNDATNRCIIPQVNVYKMQHCFILVVWSGARKGERHLQWANRFKMSHF